jgi:hypothetical protein
MKYVRLLNKLSNVLFIPMLIGVVCILIFRDELNTFKYVQLIRYSLVACGIIVVIGALLKDKNEKNN